MPISRVRDSEGRARFEFEFSRRLGGRRQRTRKLLPAAWSRARADAFDRQECARLYAQATGIEAQQWTIDQAVTRYLDERAVELKTHGGIVLELLALAPYFAGQPIEALPEVAARFAREHRATLAPATIMNRLRYLAAACRWGWKRHGMGLHDPAARVQMPAVSNERQVYIDRRQMLTLARACVHRPTRAAIRVAYYSGMRLGEIERARRVPGAFLLDDTKNGEPRVVPMHPKIRTAATVPLGSRYTRHYHFRIACASVGLHDLHFHDLRHSAASAMINAGVDLYTVGAVLGHKSAASTRRYAHLATNALEVAVGKIGRRPTSSPFAAVHKVEARAGVEPTYSDLQSRQRRVA